MRRKHFEAIAQAFAYTKPIKPSGPVYSQWSHDVEQIALALATTNPRFDKERFFRTAGAQP